MTFVCKFHSPMAQEYGVSVLFPVPFNILLKGRCVCVFFRHCLNVFGDATSCMLCL